MFLQMVLKHEVVEKELFAKVTPRMWKDLSSLIGACISILNVVAKFRRVVDSLLSNEDCPSLKTDQAEGLLMGLLKMPSKALHVWKDLRLVTIVHQTLQATQLHASSDGRLVLIIDAVVFFVLNRFLAPSLIELLPCELLVTTDNDFVEFCLTDRTRGFPKHEAQAQAALVAHVLMVAGSHGKELDAVVAQDASVVVTQI